MNTALRALTAALALTLGGQLLATAQAATPLDADGSWASFNVNGNLPPYSFAWIDDNAAALSFSFSVPVGYVGQLTVVDTGVSGDQFRVMDGGTFLGNTSSAVNGDAFGAMQFNPDLTLADGDFSRGLFTLAAGAHNISGLMIKSTRYLDPKDNTTVLTTDASMGSVRLTLAAVPEPSTSASLAAGLALLAWALRRSGARRA